MKTCWVIYCSVNKLSAYNAIKFTGDSYKDIENQIKDWMKGKTYIEVMDVAESVYEEDDDEE